MERPSHEGPNMSTELAVETGPASVPTYREIADEVLANCTDCMTDAQLDKQIMLFIRKYYPESKAYDLAKASSEVSGYLRMAGRRGGSAVRVHVTEILDRRKEEKNKKPAQKEPEFDWLQRQSGEEAQDRQARSDGYQF